MAKEDPTTISSTLLTTELEQKLDNHDNHLPKKQLYIAMCSLIVTVFLNTLDMSGTSIAVSYIASDLNSSQTIQWAGTAYSISLTAFTVLLGRFADMFGRKYVLVVSLVFMGVFQLASGFSVNGSQYYVFRALTGIGAAGSNSMAILLVTDLVPFKSRPTFQGLLGVGLGSGDTVGPLAMAAFILHTEKSWRGFYWMCFPLSLIATVLTIFYVPNSRSKLSLKEIYTHADYPGFFLITCFLVFLLLPLNGGGVIWAWGDTKIIVFFVLSGVSLIAFLVVESMRFTKLPTIPLRIFRYSGVSNMLIQCIFYGMVFQAMLYYLPYYYTIVKEYNIIQTALMSLCYVLPLAISSLNAGKLVTRLQNYNYVLIGGYALWFIGACLILLFRVNSPAYVNVLIMIVMGTGIGFTFQPSVIAIQAQGLKSDRSVIVTSRNVFRALGNAIGTAISSLIYSNVLKQQLTDADFLTESTKEYIFDNLNSDIDLSNLINDPSTLFNTKKLYMKALQMVFVLWIPLMGLCLVLSMFIRDRGLKCIDEIDKEENERRSILNSIKSRFATEKVNTA